MKFLRWSRVLATLVLLTGAAAPLAAAEKIGLVLMHGKLSNPDAPFRMISPYLEREGILVETPEMPWSKRREFDRSYDEAFTEIDAAIQKLRARGATRIVIGGHSLGAAAALIYTARKPADGLVLLALGHSPQTSVLQERFAGSVARARQQVAADQSDEKTGFDDFDASKKPPAYTVRTTPRIYLSYFDPEGIANTMKSAVAVPVGMPVLWVAGTKESPGLKSYGEKLHAATASQTKKYIEVDAGHIDTPTAAAEAVADWLKSLR